MRRLTMWAMLGAAGCVTAQRPVTLQFGAANEEPTAVVARALAAAGQPPIVVDPTLHIVQSRWEVSNFGYGFVNGMAATLVRRYTASWTKDSAGAVVATVKLDLMRCVQGDAWVMNDGREVQGMCETVAEGVPDAFQKELDAAGLSMKAALPK